MKTLLAIMLAAIAAWCEASDEVPALYRMTYGPPFGTNGETTIVLQGEKYTSREALIAAVERIPQQSRIVWQSGCIAFPELPLGPKPWMTMSGLKDFCSSRLIRFDYQWGFSDPTSWKTFATPPGLFSTQDRDGKSTDVREWFKARGITFPGGRGTFAQWQPKKQILNVRTTQENLDLIESILQNARSKAATTQQEAAVR
jgi:hypothetical protein